MYGAKAKMWDAFLEQADSVPGAPAAIKDFLLAVWDCCLAKGAEENVPDFVPAELTKRADMVLQR
jgi:hypothetical protein